MTGATPFEGEGDAFDDGRSSASGAFDDGRGTGGGSPLGEGGSDGAGRRPRIPLPRVPVEDGGRPLPAPPPAVKAGPEEPAVPAHDVLKSLLGAWALAACSGEETTAVEEHLGECGDCAEEALRLREAVGLLHRPDNLDLDPGLRTRVLDSCLERRPPRVPVPEWAAAYDAETARLDALLQDIRASEWQAAVRLRWFEGEVPTSRPTTVAGVIAHLMSVDGLVAVALGLPDPLGAAVAGRSTSEARTEACWRSGPALTTSDVRAPWREQTHALVRTVSRLDATDGPEGNGAGGNGTGGSTPDDGHGGGGGRGSGDVDGRGGGGDG
ncbi:zf-HC2 domain-containing protein, partial [Streptomyces mexicanus]